MSSITHQRVRPARRPAAMATVAAVLLTLGLINPVAAAPPNNPGSSAAAGSPPGQHRRGDRGIQPGPGRLRHDASGHYRACRSPAPEGPTARQMLGAVNDDIDTVVAPYGRTTGRLALATPGQRRPWRGSDRCRRDRPGRTPPGHPADSVARHRPLHGSGDPTYDGAFRQGLALLALASVNNDDPDGEAWLTDQQCDTGSWVAYQGRHRRPMSRRRRRSLLRPRHQLERHGPDGPGHPGVTPDHDAVTWLDGVRTLDRRVAVLR